MQTTRLVIAVVVVLGLFGAVLAAEAQQAGKVYRIRYLGAAQASEHPRSLGPSP